MEDFANNREARPFVGREDVGIFGFQAETPHTIAGAGFSQSSVAGGLESFRQQGGFGKLGVGATNEYAIARGFHL